MNLHDTREELAFITDTLTGKLPLDPFNGDWGCFARYCFMQADTANRSRFADLADAMRACGNRARRKAKTPREVTP